MHIYDYTHEYLYHPNRKFSPFWISMALSVMSPSHTLRFSFCTASPVRSGSPWAATLCSSNWRRKYTCEKGYGLKMFKPWTIYRWFTLIYQTSQWWCSIANCNKLPEGSGKFAQLCLVIRSLNVPIWWRKGLRLYNADDRIRPSIHFVIIFDGFLVGCHEGENMG